MTYRIEVQDAAGKTHARARLDAAEARDSIDLFRRDLLDPENTRIRRLVVEIEQEPAA